MLVVCLRPESLRLSRLEGTNLESLFPRISPTDCHSPGVQQGCLTWIPELGPDNSQQDVDCDENGASRVVRRRVLCGQTQGPLLPDGDFLGSLPLENSSCWESQLALSVSSTH